MLAAEYSNLYAKCTVAYQHMSARGVQPGLTRHGRILSKCESNLYCFKESLHIMSQGAGSTQGRMFPIKKKEKLSMQVENMLTGKSQKKKNPSWDTCYDFLTKEEFEHCGCL